MDAASLVEKIIKGMNRSLANSGRPVKRIWVHPDHTEALAGITEVNGVAVVIPSWDYLEALAATFGYSARDKVFWDSNHAYFTTSDPEDWLRLKDPSA